MDSYTKLAQKTIETYLTTGKIISVPLNLPEELLKYKAGVFVSLHKKGKLRGCIGTLEATTSNIALEIIQNSLSAALEDPRFEPMDKSELQDLKISVDVLNTPVKINDRSELDIKKYGIICQSGFKKGLLLPDIEGIASVDEQIDIACQKAGINPLKDKFDIYKFTVTRHE